MSKIIESKLLIYVEAEENSSKFWRGDVYEDGTVHCEWGRVGNTNPQSKTFSGGQSYLNKKVAEKKKKGYVEAKTISENTTKVVSNVHSIAKAQIQVDNPVAQKLIDRLVAANVHQITANSQISFNENSGVFQTPLGVVTQEGISEANQILSEINGIIGQAGSPKFYNTVNQYLRIVPQNVGRTVKGFIDLNFSSTEGIKKQLDLLQSLEVSFQTLSQSTDSKKNAEEVLEKVFDVGVRVLDQDSEYERLRKNFYDTKKSMHNYDKVHVKNIYEVDLREMSKNFDKDKVGNHKEFYHGTSIANCLSILKSGLKVSPPSTAAIAGKLFGNGVYGADCSSKSLGYSLGRWGQGASRDGAWLFICDFAMGRAYEPTSYGIRGIPQGYDSCVALARKTGLHNNEFIVYKNHQVKIKYLIECSA
jgi:poly [ADP-ribose] polymerase